MEFSARLVLSSNSGYYKKRVNFFHSASAYWQALLSALEGNATERAASILSASDVPPFLTHIGLVQDANGFDFLAMEGELGRVVQH
jgi:hypothetical protein